jgi:hypothetical protein
MATKRLPKATIVAMDRKLKKRIQVEIVTTCNENPGKETRKSSQLSVMKDLTMPYITDPKRQK